MRGEKQKFSFPQKRQEPLDLDPELPAGIYTLEADWNGQLLAGRSFRRLINWEDMEPSDSVSEQAVIIGFNGKNLAVSGAILGDLSKEKEELHHAWSGDTLSNEPLRMDAPGA